MVSSNGAMNVDVSPTASVQLESLYPTVLPKPFRPSPLTGGALLDESGEPKLWTVLLDTQPTQPSMFTNLKTTARDMYNTSRERVGIRSMTEKNEVILCVGLLLAPLPIIRAETIA